MYSWDGLLRNRQGRIILDEELTYTEYIDSIKNPTDFELELELKVLLYVCEH